MYLLSRQFCMHVCKFSWFFAHAYLHGEVACVDIQRNMLAVTNYLVILLS